MSVEASFLHFHHSIISSLYRYVTYGTVFSVSPFPWEIYERCPGGPEFLPHQVLCDRITTVSVPQRELVQGRMHWSFKVERKAGQRKMGWVGGVVMKWEGEKISLHSGPHGGAARAIMWMETISFPDFDAEVGASVFPQLSVWLTCILSPAASSDLYRKIIVRIIPTEQSAHGEIPLCLSCSRAVIHSKLHADPMWLFLLRSRLGVNCSLTPSALEEYR